MIAGVPDPRAQLEQRVAALTARYHHDMTAMLVRADCVSAQVGVRMDLGEDNRTQEAL